MIEQGWSRKSAALCCAALLCISLAGCGGGGAWEQTESAQSLPAGETAAPKTPEVITALKFISPSKPVVMEIDKGETLKLSAQSAGYQSGFKAFYFYSSDPSVLEAEVDQVLMTAISGAAIPKKPGVVDLFCATADGKLVSEPIQVKVVQNMEQYDADKHSSTITKIDLKQTDNIWLKSGSTSYLIAGVSYEALFPQDYRFIEFMSSDPSVATVALDERTENTLRYYQTNPPLTAKITIHKDGQAQIYAQTKDGKIKSEPVMLMVGNQYNAEQIARTDVEKYVFERLKYPRITSRELQEGKDAYVNNHFFPWQDKKTYTYKDHTEYSKVTIRNLKTDGRLVNADGGISTFNASGIPVNCTFKLQLQYQEDWKQYQVKSAVFSDPDLIVKSLD